MDRSTGPTSPAQSRVALLDAAEQVFAEHGFEATTLRDIAVLAGVTHGLVRHHFASKDGLWRAVLDRAIERYAAAMGPHTAQATDAAPDPRAATRAAARGFLDVSMRHPHVVRLMLHESVSGGARLDYLLSRYLHMAATMGPLFQRAQQAGYLRQFDQASLFLFMLTAGAMPFALSALCRGVLGAELDPDAEQSQRHIQRILDTLLGHDPAPHRSQAAP